MVTVAPDADLGQVQVPLATPEARLGAVGDGACTGAARGRYGEGDPLAPVEVPEGAAPLVTVDVGVGPDGPVAVTKTVTRREGRGGVGGCLEKEGSGRGGQGDTGG